MDSSKLPSAPPTDWSSDEKSRQPQMGQPAPPPYEDYPQYPNPGYPGQAYPPYPQGYGNPAQPLGVNYGQQPYGMAAGMQHPGQPGAVAVTMQPTRCPLTNPANDYLGYSIFTLLCCCLPLGIAALIYSILTRDANYAGDQMAAERNSRMARLLNHVGLGIGLAVLILTIVYVAVVVSAH
ncbi:proline-rich transmembrane protein 1 [Myripristis murdjan]|uniref:proline-rich transmembrane protein 1 n=1 Tax=Myripristis murdjan TaxID=586833 RepID=UPI001175CA62|nr:proline-rich transmembrane protein 1-like [Myripristis murdjan]